MKAKTKMKFLTYITVGITALSISSCQNDNEEGYVPQTPNTPTFKLEIKDAQNSRTLINDYSVSWAEGDKLAIFYGSRNSPIPFTVTTTDEGATATSDIDTTWEQGNTFYATYPYIGSSQDAHNITVELPTTFTQSSAEATELGNYDIMVAEPVLWSNEEPTLKFHHAVSFIDFIISNDSDEAMEILGVEMSTEGDILPISGTIDATASIEGKGFATIVPTEFCSNIKIDASGSWTTLKAGEAATLRMVIIPTNLENEIIKVTFKTSKETRVIETYGKKLERGYAYGFNKSLGWDGSSQEVEGLTEFKFTTVNNSNLYQDIVFTKQKDNSYMATVVPEVDLSAIIPTFDYSGNVTVDGEKVSSDKTSIDFRDEMLFRFDSKLVKFTVKREYAVPIVYINTDNSVNVTSKEYYLGCRVKIDGKNLYEDYITITEADSIRGRGNSTWDWYPKKPYRIKLDKKESLLGLNKGKSYVLLANYRDPSNMMNAVAFDMAHYMEMPYTNNYRFVEVYLNNDYIGLYMLTEQIQQGGKRVDVEDQGGLLLSLDCDDGPNLSPDATDNFLSEEIYVNYSNSNIPVCVKHPEDPTAAQIEEIRSQFGDLERIILDYDYEEFKKCMNVQSYMSFFIIQEMTRNVELPAPRSMYIHRHADGMWAMGPVWDFDGGFAYDWGENHGYFGNQSWVCGEHPGDRIDGGTDFFDRMFANEEYKADFKEYWDQVSQGMYDYAMERMQANYKQSKAAMQRDAERWPISKSYSTSISQLRSWLEERIERYQSVVDNM